MPGTPETFVIEAPSFAADSRIARFGYRLGDLSFEERLTFPPGFDPEVVYGAAFRHLLDLTAFVLGVSYFKLRAPFVIQSELPLSSRERAFVIDVYENGLGEFYARNALKRFGKLTLQAPERTLQSAPVPVLADRALLPNGGGKDSLVSVQLLEAAGLDFVPFAVNPKGPILGSVEKTGRAPLYVTRRLDPEMIRLGKEPGYYNGHVPSTAINSMIAALTALLYSANRIILSNERSASEGNVEFDGREANHQHSKSIDFERLIAEVLSDATGGALGYFSLLRPYSEARIAELFARETRFDHVFSSCNENFKLAGHDGPLWCGRCPKCHFVFLIFAPVMDKARLTGIFGQDLLAQPAHERSFRELTGLAGQKPWECVGEIEEAAACLFALADNPEWRDEPIVRLLHDDLIAQYGRPRLEAALADLMTDATEHLIPAPIAERVARHAL
jgi:UDP-N-acetyl-alpha-D-muramoyl-L-alanyl-L-glutamate epimerase